MMPWLLLGVISSFFFRVGTASANGNGVIELNSARELGRKFGGGVHILVVSLKSPKVNLLSFQTPTNPSAGNNFGM